MATEVSADSGNYSLSGVSAAERGSETAQVKPVTDEDGSPARAFRQSEQETRAAMSHRLPVLAFIR
jgi:hypothetical protein